jgi:hypothetical protein
MVKLINVKYNDILKFITTTLAMLMYGCWQEGGVCQLARFSREPIQEPELFFLVIE